ncbi:hypothetical protein ECDEC12A_0978 [Escherichia coli DEC12A]|nr:hypothetical protein ECDEC12A_0978 [Escherichia coli DEC12A]
MSPSPPTENESKEKTKKTDQCHPLTANAGAVIMAFRLC